MKHGVRSLVAMATVALLGAALAPSLAEARSAYPRYVEYVALGDSWSADVVFFDKDGLPDSRHVPIDCAQSHRNYPKLVARALKVARFKDATCGSATTDHFTRPQALPLGGKNPPQFNRLTKRTDLVTVGIGGNDSGFASAALSCLSVSPVGIPLPVLPLPEIPLPLFSLSTLPTGACKERFTAGGVDQLARRIAASEIKLVRAFRQIHRISPKARILAVNYIDGIPAKGCWPLVPITDPDMAYLHATFVRLNAMVARAARRGGAQIVDAFSATRGHDVCTAPTRRYVEGLGVVSVNDLAIAVPAHPNSAGAAAQARAVLARIAK